MMNRELLEAVNSQRPDLMKKTAEALALIEKLDASFLPEVFEDFAVISNVTTEKLASAVPSLAARAGGAAKQVGIGVGVTLAAGLATSIATDLYDAAKRGLTRSSNFKRIMSANPDLKNYDQKRLRSSFDTLHRYGPEFTADPLMGGSLLKAMAGLDGHEYTVIKDVINSRKGFLDAKARQYQPTRVDGFRMGPSSKGKKPSTATETNE